MGYPERRETLYQTLWRKPPYLPTEPLLANLENPRHAIQMLCRGLTKEGSMEKIMFEKGEIIEAVHPETRCWLTAIFHKQIDTEHV